MRTIQITEETYEAIKDKLNETEKIDLSSLDELVGKKLFLRSVTYHMLGKCVRKVGDFMQLDDASWIADSGRFSNFIKEGNIDNAEIEPVGTVWVNLSTVVDFYIWKHDLPLKQK